MKAEGRRQKVEGGGKERRRGSLPRHPLFASSSFRLLAFCLLPSAFCLLPSAFCETLTLDDCLRETAAANPAVVTQQFAVQRALGEKLVFRSRALPTLSFTGVAGYQGAQTAATLRSAGVDANGKPLPETTSLRNSTVILVASGQVTQPIFDAAIPASWRLGTLGVTAAQENVYTVATAQLFRARTLFNRALYYHEREGILGLFKASLQSGRRAQEALVAAGLGTRQGVLNAQVQQANFDPAVTTNGGTYRTTLATLLEVMGRPLPTARGPGGDPLDGITLAGALEDTPLVFDPAAAGREALASRPDLEALRTTMRIYAEQGNVARAGYYPNVQIYVAGQYLPTSYIQSQSASSRASDRVETTEIRPGARGNWTVIDTGAVLGATRQFGALRGVIGANLRQLEQAVPANLATVHAQAAAAVQARELLGGNVATAQDTLNIIQAGVAQGVNSQLEFLEAQDSVFAARLGLLDARLTLSQAHAEFDRITGRYLRFATTPRADNHPAPAKKE